MLLDQLLDKNGAINFRNLNDSKQLISLSNQTLAWYKKEITKITENPITDFESTIKAYSELSNYMLICANIVSFLNSSGRFDHIKNFLFEFDIMYYQAVRFETSQKALLSKIKFIYKNKKTLIKDKNDMALTENVYHSFYVNGSFLSETKRKRVIEINSQIEILSHNFVKNSLKEESQKTIFIKNIADLAGVPKNKISEYKKNASKKKIKGYSIPVNTSEYLTIAQNCEIEATRLKIHKKAYTIGSNKNKFSNLPVIKRLLKLKHEKARLFGFANFAEFSANKDRCFNNVQENKETLLNFIQQNNTLIDIEKNHLLKVKKSLNYSENHDELLGHDLRYLENKQNKLDIDITKYFTLENTLNSLLNFSKKYFGITIKETNEIPNLPEDIKSFKITEKGKLLGYLYLDPFFKANKEVGCFHKELSMASKYSPVANYYLNTSYKKSENVFLNFEEVVDLYHEFGHFFQILMGKNIHPAIRGSMEWDFVEFPSLLFEKLLTNKNYVQSWATHYKTKKKLPLTILKKLKTDGYPLITQQRHALYSLLDLELYQTDPRKIGSVVEFERNFFKKYKKFSLHDIIDERHIYLPILEHIFGSYDASYYAYVYALALESTCFKKIENTPYQKWGSFFNKLKIKFFAKLGSENSLVLYKKLTKEDPSFNDWHKQILLNYN